MLFMGIDPGLSGGIAVLDEYRKIVSLKEMPKTEHDVWMSINKWSTALAPTVTISCAIEEITTSIFGAAKSSMSKLYGSYMALRMALTAAAIPFDLVHSKIWQRDIMLSPRKKGEADNNWKSRLKQKAQQLYPRDPRITKGTADALLIAHYLVKRSANAKVS